MSVNLLRASRSSRQAALRAIPVAGWQGRQHLLGYARALHSTRPAAEVIRRCDATSRWVSGEMSNFDYLMMLNTTAGRNYHDLAQCVQHRQKFAWSGGRISVACAQIVLCAWTLSF